MRPDSVPGPAGALTRTILAVSLATGIAVAASTSYTLTINGKPAAARAIVVDGRTYVPLAALQAAGATSRLAAGTLALTLPGAPGGANGRVSVEGCLGEFLFNGVWRLRVNKVEPARQPGSGDPGIPGWAVAVELRNGTTRTLSPSKTGIDAGGRGISLATDDGNTLSLRAGSDWVDFASKAIPQGAAGIHRMGFFYPVADAAPRKPTKLLLEINTDELRNWTETRDLRYGVPNPSFRVRLDCTS